MKRMIKLAAALTITALVLLRLKLIQGEQRARQAAEGSDYLEESPHVDGPNCWCNPTLFFDGEGVYGDVWVHKGAGDELPPSKILAAAIADAVRED